MENSEEVFQEFITDNYKRLTNHTLVTSGLLIDLFSKRVIDKDEKETIVSPVTLRHGDYLFTFISSLTSPTIASVLLTVFHSLQPRQTQTKMTSFGPS